MKVGIIGNMNNNHFSLMRYFRDLGIDAYLLLYTNDGSGSLSHFVPENDTWEIEKWMQYIIQTKLSNGKDSFFYHLLFSEYTKNLLNSYDILIGNGLSPGYSYIAKKELCLFVPYSFGGEFLVDNVHLTFRQRLKFLLFRYYQQKGLKKYVKYVVALDRTKKNCVNFSDLGSSIISLGVPMVYNGEDVNLAKCIVRSEIQCIIEKMQHSDYVIFSHVSHNYRNLDNECFDIKKNKILIEGFALFLKQTRCRQPTLFLLEYGKDVQESKAFIKSLNIENSVIWLPLMARKEIMLLLEYVDIGGGEFGGVVWGGTGYEFMAKGVPFLQSVDMAAETFQDFSGIPLPPIFNVSTPGKIRDVLFQYEKKPDLLKIRGRRLRDWFDRYNGIGLAKEYLKLIASSEGMTNNRQVDSQ